MCCGGCPRQREIHLKAAFDCISKAIVKAKVHMLGDFSIIGGIDQGHFRNPIIWGLIALFGSSPPFFFLVGVLNASHFRNENCYSPSPCQTFPRLTQLSRGTITMLSPALLSLFFFFFLNFIFF